MIADPLENGKVPFDRDHNIPANDLDRLTGANQPLQWADLDCDEQLDLILNNPMRSAWLLPEAIETLTFFRKIPQQWAYIKARYAEIYGSTKDLEKAVDTQLEVDLAKAKKSAQKDSEGLSSHLVRTDCELGTPHEIKGKRFSSLNSLSSQGDNWPVLQPEALYGLAGDIVKKLTPHTEADPVAILTQFLTYSGVVIGRKQFYQVEATRHYINMFLAIVGNTAKGRKGTSFGHVDEGMRAIDGTWTEDNLASACGSGEGLIAAVRDATYVTQPIKEKGRVVDYQQVMTDPGVEDKRLLVAEQEFSSCTEDRQPRGQYPQ